MCARFEKVFIKYVFLTLLLAIRLEALFKITSVDCRSEDKTFATFEYCRLKAVRRGVSEFSFLIHLLQRVDSAKLNLAMMRKFSVYRTFLMDRTIDMCDFMEHRKRWVVFNVIYNTFKNYTNINHTCPYSGDVFMDRLAPQHNDLRLPLPNGQYMFKSDWILNKKLRLHVSVAFTFEEPTTAGG